MKLTSLHGFQILGTIALLNFALIAGGQTILKTLQVSLTPNMSEEELWRVYRWSIDPYQRREASLLLVSKSKDSPFRRKRLLPNFGEDGLHNLQDAGTIF